jgi:hypothetical protein
MAWAGHEPEELRAGEDKVEDLREEEEEESFGKVRLDADDSKSHARCVAEGIAWEDASRVPVILALVSNRNKRE